MNSDILQSLISNASETDKVIFEYIDWVRETSDAPYVPNLPGYNETSALFTKTMEAVSFGKKSVDEAAQEYYSELHQIVSKYVQGAQTTSK